MILRRLKFLMLWLSTIALLVLVVGRSVEAKPATQSNADAFPTTWQLATEQRLTADIYDPKAMFIPGSVVQLDNGSCRLYFTIVLGTGDTFAPSNADGSGSPSGPPASGNAPPIATPIAQNPEGGTVPGGEGPFQADGVGTCGQVIETVALDPSQLPATGPDFTSGQPGVPPADAPFVGTPSAEGAVPPAEGSGPPTNDGNLPPTGGSVPGATPAAGGEATPSNIAPPIGPPVTPAPTVSGQAGGFPPSDSSGPPFNQPATRPQVIGIGSAVSLDGLHWTFEPQLVLRSRDVVGELHYAVSNPHVVRLADGRWRMYYETKTNDDTPTQIASAISYDGRTFENESALRIGLDAAPGLLDVNSPSVWRDETNVWWMLFGAKVQPLPAEGSTEPAQPVDSIGIARSDDGLVWTVVNPILFTGVYAPKVITLPDNSLLALWVGADGQLLTSVPLASDLWFDAVPLTILDSDGVPFDTMLLEVGTPQERRRFSRVAPLLTLDGTWQLFVGNGRHIGVLNPVIETPATSE